MKNSETGEFELVLGNKQLLSGFFIVVILFGVFFTMGYIVGRNSSPASHMAGAGEPIAAAPLTAPISPMPQQAPPVAPAPGDAAQPQPSDAAAGEQPASAAQQPQPATAPAQAEPAKSAAPPPASAKSITEPIPGETYLQVMAVKRPEAEVVAKTLRDKGFKTVLGPGPNDLVRVLVGPFSDTASIGAAKAKLENAGFQPIVRK